MTSRPAPVLRLALFALVTLHATSLVACAASPPFPTPIPSLSHTPAPTRTATPIPVSPTPPPTPTSTPPIIDYRPLLDEIQDYLNRSGLGPQFDLAVGFVDIRTGQKLSFDGETRHYALSTFKGPLAAFYLWLVENHQLEPQVSDEAYLVPMLAESSNPATSCILKRIGGLAPFNDWLADQGLDRRNNFVASWQSWACNEGGQGALIAPDLRYMRGDASLDLPGDYALFRCYPTYRNCDKAFTPLELAMFYARLYQGEVLSPENTARWLDWMEKERDDAALSKDLPPEVEIRAFVKNGFRHSDEEVAVHFYHEAGIIETPDGAYALAVFTQGSPDWPATRPLASIGRIIYDGFAMVDTSSHND